MAYVTVKGGEQAIDNAHAWLAEERRGDRANKLLDNKRLDQHRIDGEDAS